MNQTASISRNRAPAIQYARIAPRSGSRYPPPEHHNDARNEIEGSTSERLASLDYATTQHSNQNSLEWAINRRGIEHGSKTTREILDSIDAATLRAALQEGEIKQQIVVNRDRIAALLGLRDEWTRPDEVYSDEAWEICIVWRSFHGVVEIGTEDDGSISYFVKRTLGSERREGIIQECDTNELRKIFSWLEADPEDI